MVGCKRQQLMLLHIPLFLILVPANVHAQDNTEPGTDCKNAGWYLDNTCKACSTGYMCPEGSNIMVACAAGTYQVGT